MQLSIGISRYIEGDKRFKGLSGNKRKIIFAWASKEFRNLQRLKSAGVRVPKPIRNHRNMLLMEYIGSKKGPAPIIKNAEIDDPMKTYEQIIKYMSYAYQKAELVHADLSEYNILYHRKRPVIIDCGQAVLIEHMNAKEFLHRDINNINRYFRSLDVKIRTGEDIFHEVVEG